MNELIDKELQFYSFIDFYKKKEIIKEKYQLLEDKKEIRIYKMYVYSTCFETENTKDLIWEYLNSDEINARLEICREFSNRMRRNKRKG